MTVRLLSKYEPSILSDKENSMCVAATGFWIVPKFSYVNLQSNHRKSCQLILKEFYLKSICNLYAYSVRRYIKFVDLPKKN